MGKGRPMATLFVAAAVTLGLAACGSDGPPHGALREGAVSHLLCHPPGMTIELHNSGISCQQAGATVLLRAAGMEGPQVVREKDGGSWICRDISAPGRPELLKCTQGKRFYTISSVERDER